MPKYRKILLVILLVIVMGSIIIVNVRGTIQAYYGFYYSREEVNTNPVYRQLAFVEELRPYNLLLSYTGLETGYGFFAPNVASDFLVELTCTDKQGRVRNVRASPVFATKEGFLRMNTATSMFIAYTRKDSTEQEMMQCRIFLRGLCLRVLERDPLVASVTARVYLYHHPFLKDYKTVPEPSPSYILYETRTFHRNDPGAW